MAKLLTVLKLYFYDIPVPKMMYQMLTHRTWLVIPASKSLEQENPQKSEASQGYVVRSCFQSTTQNRGR